MAFAPCACCKRLSRMALEEAFAVQSRDNDKAADALLRCRPCLKEAEAEAASAPKGGSSKGHGKGGKGNVSDSHKSSSKGKAATAATAATGSSGYATLVCLTCGHSCCESHAMTHCQSASSTNKKDRGPGDHCVFLNHGGGSLLHQSVAGFCFRCQIPVGGGEPEDLDFAENRGGAAVNSEGYCIDFEDTFSDPANVVIEMMVNGRTAARGKAGDSDGEGGDDRRRRKKDKLDKKEKRHKRDRDDVEKSSRKRKHRDGGGGDVESAAVRATNKAAMKEGGMVGLQNMGNTCFYNSTLQCLSRAAPLTAAFANLGTSQFCPGPLSQSIFSTLETMLDPSNAGTTIVPKGLFNQLCRRNCMFSEYGQQDAQEVFSCIMNGVEDEYQVRGGGSANSPTMVVGGQLRSSILCSQCRTTTSREDRFLDLSVAVQGGIRSIGAALRAYFLPEELSGENAYACERCHAERFAAEKRRVEAEKLARQREAQSLCEAAALEPVTETVDRVRDEDNSSDDDDDDSDSSSCSSDEAAAGVAAAEVVPKSAQSVAAAIPIAPTVQEPAVVVEEPVLSVKPRSGGFVKVDAVMTPSVAHLGDVIVVHLKRFAVNMRTLTWEKSDAVVAIDPIIDMVPYLSSAPTRKTLYALSGVVSHSGSLSGGHYIAYVKSATNHQWYRCSDESVSLSSESSALSAQCYMAFYTLAE